MSMEPQVREATGKSSFTVLERHTDPYHVEKVRVSNEYGTHTMEVGSPHKGCEFDGTNLISREAWADIINCTGCNYSIYYPIGD